MNTVRLQQARRLFSSPYVHPHVNRENQRRWVRSVRRLGAKWIALPKEASHGRA